MERTTEWLRTAGGRGWLLITIATFAVGFALSAQQNIVSNFFEHVLGLSGPQFGYITAVREIPGFLLIFITAIFYRLPLPKITAGALVLLAVGYSLFGTATSFWGVAPWVVLSSMGYHTFFQTQSALALSLTDEKRAGSILGHISAVNSLGGLAAMGVVLLGFETGWLGFGSTFVLCGAFAAIAAIAIVTFPELRDGKQAAYVPRREPIVVRREYIYYYGLKMLDGGRQQIFFSFGLWVLVNHFKLDVPMISAVLIATSLVNTLIGRRIGRLFDKHGEKPMLAIANVGYIVALLGYGLIDNVYVAVVCYVIYTLIFPLSGIGAATYLRKVAVVDEIAPSLALGLTLEHAAAIVVPLATGFVLNYVGYQFPFLVATVFALITFFFTRRLDPQTQKSPRRVAEEARLAAV